MKKGIKYCLFISLLLCFITLGIYGCRKADTVTYNIKKNADYFNVYREITFVNLRSDKILYQGEGYFSISNSATNELCLTFRVARDEYKIIYLSTHENVAYVINQVENTHTDPYHYEFKWFIATPKIESDSELDK